MTEMTTEPTSQADAVPGAALARRHRRVGLYAASGAAVMLMLAFASVPLYRMFCQVTGYAGTTQKAAKPSDVILDRRMTVRFDASVSPGLDWTVQPVEATQSVRIGETSLAYYRATNNSSKTLTGTASFNVTPEQTGGFFNKLACFCFTEQRLEPGQSIDMPVSYFIDPAIVSDKDAGHVGMITLSYTFFLVDNPKVSTAASAKAGKGS
jgi:cytochrome c oxidase assembly protein subunit 11